MKFSLSDVVEQSAELLPHSHVGVLLLTENDRPARRGAQGKVHREAVAVEFDVQLHCFWVAIVGGGATGVRHLVVLDVCLLFVFLLPFPQAYHPLPIVHHAPVIKHHLSII